VIALLAFLGVRALRTNGSKPTAWTFSRFVNAVGTDAGGVESVTVDQSRQSLSATINGQTVTVDYPAQALPGLEHVMRAHEVSYKPKTSGGTAWWRVLAGVIAFVLLIALWIFRMKTVRTRRANA